MTKVLLFLIKLVQSLMLLSAMAAFAYGALHLSQAAWWRFAGETVQGQVVEEGMGTERRSNPQARSGRTITQYETVLVYRPVAQYVAPRDRNRAHRVAATLTLEGREAEAYLKGGTVEVRFDPAAPESAYLPLPAGAYFWPAVGFFAGAAVLLVLVAFFYLHEAAFGRNLSAGVSLFRRLRTGHAIGFAVLAAALLGGTHYIASGLVAPPPPGAKLNASEALLALGLRPSADPLFDARLTAERMKLPEFAAALREAVQGEKLK